MGIQWVSPQLLWSQGARRPRTRALPNTASSTTAVVSHTEAVEPSCCFYLGHGLSGVASHQYPRTAISGTQSVHIAQQIGLGDDSNQLGTINHGKAANTFLEH